MSPVLIQREVEIINQKGLHARASAKFVKLASAYDATVTVTKDGTTVDAQSIMGLLMLGAGIGSTITIAAEGEDATAAMEALRDLISRRFDEDA